MAVDNRRDAGIFIILTTTGHLSLFPLIFTAPGNREGGGLIHLKYVLFIYLLQNLCMIKHACHSNSNNISLYELLENI